MFRNEGAKKIASGAWSWLQVILFPITAPLVFLKRVTEGIKDSDEGSITVGFIFFAIFAIFGGIKGCQYMNHDEAEELAKRNKEIEYLATTKAQAIVKQAQANNYSVKWYDAGIVVNDDMIINGVYSDKSEAKDKNSKKLVASAAYCEMTLSKFGTVKFNYQQNTALCDAPIVKGSQTYLKHKMLNNTNNGQIWLCVHKAKCFNVNGEWFIDPSTLHQVADPFATGAKNVSK